MANLAFLGLGVIGAPMAGHLVTVRRAAADFKSGLDMATPVRRLDR